MNKDAQTDWSLIDKVIYINLDRRPDRKAHILNQLDKIQVPTEKIVRVSATPHELGYIGAAYSHRAVMELCIENDWQRVMILEDDAYFYHRADAQRMLDRIQLLCEHAPSRWDVLMPSANYVVYHKTDLADDLYRLNDAYCGHCYIVNHHYFSALYHNLNRSITTLLASQKQTDAFDVGWSQLMRQDVWFGMLPMVGFQINNYSDIQKGVINYDEYLTERFADYLKPII